MSKLTVISDKDMIKIFQKLGVTEKIINGYVLLSGILKKQVGKSRYFILNI